MIQTNKPPHVAMLQALPILAWYYNCFISVWTAYTRYDILSVNFISKFYIYFYSAHDDIWSTTESSRYVDTDLILTVFIDSNWPFMASIHKQRILDCCYLELIGEQYTWWASVEQC